MKNFLLVSIFLALFTSYSFAQCPSGQVEIRVDILTDDYGYENYWTLSDESGGIIIQGGQGGVYENLHGLSNGIYILKIELADGAQMNKRIIVLR